jgi:phosphatidylglycerol---prolipoprotein diacylglyceryl transferase
MLSSLTMVPAIFGMQTYFPMWAVTTALAMWVALRLSLVAGFPPARSLVAFCMLAPTMIVGSKLLFLAEHAVFPQDDPFQISQDSVSSILQYGFRNPGGLVLFAAALPVVCRVLRLPTLRFADAVIPAMGIVIACFRVGCFLNGCCFGRITASPLSVTFPPESRVFIWQVLQGMLGAHAIRSLPVHPLQLYFALFGIGLYLLGRYSQQRKRFDGEVLLTFCGAYFLGAFFLDWWQAVPPRVWRQLAHAKHRSSMR